MNEEKFITKVLMLGKIIFAIAMFEITYGTKFPENYRDVVDKYKKEIIKRDKERNPQ